MIELDADALEKPHGGPYRYDPPGPADLWRFAEAHQRDPEAVAPLKDALLTWSAHRARMTEEVQRATGGRRREMRAEEVARYHLGLCVWCEAPRPGRGRYCGERCRRERNQPGTGPGEEAEWDRRRRALRLRTRETVRKALLSWMTREPGAWSKGHDPEAEALLRDLETDLRAMLAEGRAMGAEGVGQRYARQRLADALEEPAPLETDESRGIGCYG